MSRQRHDSKRNDARPASPAPRRRRPTNKATQTSQAASAGSRKKRSASQSPQLVVTTPKTAPQKSPKTPRRQTGQPRTTKTSVAARIAEPVDVPAVARMPEPSHIPETPEVPEIPETPEVPEIPETPEIPQTPEEPAVPEVPETPEQPETPETPPEQPEVPEVPEVPEEPERPEEPEQPGQPKEPERREPPETPETPTVPDTPAEPSEPVRPVEPSEPDNPAVRAPGTPPHDRETHKAPHAPTAKERRKPTLAVMAHRRHDSAAGRDHKAGTTGDDHETGVASPCPQREQRDTPPAESSPAASPQRGESPARPAAARTPRARIASVRKALQETSVITRPVSARYSHRGNATGMPDLVWEDDPRLAYLPWPMRRPSGSRPRTLPPADVLIPVVVAHIFVMAILGLTGAVLGLDNRGTVGSWTLIGAAIAGLGGSIAYGFSESAALRHYAPRVLGLSQLALLAWSLAVFGPRASLLALAPAMIEIMLLMGSTWLASGIALGALLVYALFAGLALGVGLTPVVALDQQGAMVLDVFGIVAGVLAAFWLLLAIQSGRERAQAIARARRHEADVLRRLLTQFHQEVQDDTSRLESALLQALKGHGIASIPAEGRYRLLAETIMDTASRLEVLQRDREERLRLEGALRVIIRAVEREWLGVEPEWPAPTGTLVDELVALLRTPRLSVTYQNEARTPSITPKLIPLPTLTSRRDTPPVPVSRPLNSEPWLSPRRRIRRTDLYPVPSPEEEFPEPDRADEPGRSFPPLQSGSLWPAQDDD